jgi:hypothetical protein
MFGDQKNKLLGGLPSQMKILDNVVIGLESLSRAEKEAAKATGTLA